VLICLVPLNPGPPSVIPLDKLAHLLLFAGFAGLWLKSYPRSLLKIAIAGLLLGLGIEMAQSALNWGRMGDGADFFADCVGLLLGFGAGAKLNGAKSRREGAELRG